MPVFTLGKGATMNLPKSNYMHVEPNSDFKFIEQNSIDVKRYDESFGTGYTVRMTPMVGDEIRVALDEKQMRKLMTDVMATLAQSDMKKADKKDWKTIL